MSRWRCNCCGGTYDDVLPNGMLYFHACPPVWDKAAGAWVLPPGGRDENILPGVRINISADRVTTITDATDRVVDTDPDHLPIRAEGRGRTLVPPRDTPPGRSSP